MKDAIVSDVKLVAYCGLYCGACGAYAKGRCPGCHENTTATWCKVRSCCMEHNYSTCAECSAYRNAKDCRKFDNFISKAVGFFLRSDRAACIRQVRELGVAGHADDMARNKRQTIRRGSPRP